MKRRFCMGFRLGTLIGACVVMVAWGANGAVVLQDGFNNGTISTPDFSTVGNWSLDSATNASEAGGILTVGTQNSTASTSNNLRINTTSGLNPFTSTVQISVREFDLFGTGSYEPATAGRFRLGLVSENGSFFGANDGFALEINNNGLGARLGTKLNAPSADPNSSAVNLSGLASAITGFDLVVDFDSWELILYSDSGILYEGEGAWSLGTAAEWGTGTANVGNSALLLAVQNAGAVAPLTGFKSFSMGSIEVTTTVIPEPSRAMLLMLAGIGVAFWRKR
ncbi:PEP-CTERM sorting domain-containing protein [Phragmitibacter flavus]|uniref:PEP-CTERM sorting domain-containing protein n=1 Tax=Phragmitibacter flavus TaxID=2576071 RepID=A0A5R8KJ59_9BACT|nr:PEP-CTERM sorting domain-containing protein [Phragmitibacter flavus]TLD71649.1 PEP-CTERM sorting domain-containing protein [Phragmitibacter flavus]